MGEGLDLASAQDLLARLEATSMTEFMQIGGGETLGEGVFSMPFPIYAPVEQEWVQAMLVFGVGDRSTTYDQILKGERRRPDLAAIGRADRDELIGYATYVIRGERFCDGHIGGAHEDGLLCAILRRFIQLGLPASGDQPA